MAHMYPEEYHEDPDSPSPAERKLFAAFRTQLSDRWTVFHARSWNALNDRGAARDGEADFVLAHPELGILILEAKSGGVAYDAKGGKWRAVGLGGHTGKEIGNPVRQGGRNRGTLLRLLKSLPASGDRRWPIGWAVAFPDVNFDLAVTGLPDVLVLDRRDMNSLESWAEAAMGYWRDPDHPGPLGEDGLAILTALLAGSHMVEPVTGAQLDEIEAELITLTDRQYQVLDSLQETPRAS